MLRPEHLHQKSAAPGGIAATLAAGKKRDEGQSGVLTTLRASSVLYEKPTSLGRPEHPSVLDREQATSRRALLSCRYRRSSQWSLWCWKPDLRHEVVSMTGSGKRYFTMPQKMSVYVGGASLVVGAASVARYVLARSAAPCDAADPLRSN